MVKIQRVHERVQELEREIAQKLEKTGLVSNVKIKGELKNLENPLRLEYKIKQNEAFEYNVKKVRVLRGRLVNILLRNYPEIKEIKKDYHEESGLYREILVINPEAKIGEEAEATLKYNLLSSIKKETENYLVQEKSEEGKKSVKYA